MIKDMEVFNAISDSYDNSRRTERAKAIADELRSHIVARPDTDAIEYGCGTGLVGLQLADMFRSLLLVDYSSGMLKQAERKIQDLMINNVSTLCSDFLKGVPEGLHADCIFISMALHHIKDTEGIFNIFYNILNPGGQLLVVDINSGGSDFHAKYPGFSGHNGFEQEALIEQAAALGFSAIEAKTFYQSGKNVSGEWIPYSLFCLTAKRQLKE
jgi:ubiquinone/menaquinone biosynthesis C-methylase UbiE